MSTTNPAPTSEPPSTAAPPKKKSLYRRIKDARAAKFNNITDEDLQKHTGKTKAELAAWAKDRPGVGSNQAAGSITVGPASGLGGMAAAEGFGGWGTGARGELKFPPVQRSEARVKMVEAEDSEDEGERGR